MTTPPDDIRCDDEEGRRYRDGVYSPLDERTLAPAPPELIESLLWHPVRGALYAVWFASIVWFAWILFRPRTGEAS